MALCGLTWQGYLMIERDLGVACKGRVKPSYLVVNPLEVRNQSYNEISALFERFPEKGYIPCDTGIQTADTSNGPEYPLPFKIP